MLPTSTPSTTPLLRELQGDSPRSPHAWNRWNWRRVELWAALAALLLVAAVVAVRLTQRPRSGEAVHTPTLSFKADPVHSSGGLEARADQKVARSAREWDAYPDSAFQAPQSGCVISPDGQVSTLPQAPDELPFLFNLSSRAVPSRKQACSHCGPRTTNCEAGTLPYLCCGVCQFAGRLCRKLYPDQQKPEEAAGRFMAEGHLLQAFTPCELFQRIRGRTLWLLGDSQTQNLYYAVECFLRGFAPSLQRMEPFSRRKLAKQLTTAEAKLCDRWFPVPPLCLPLAQGTRVCLVRVDTAGDLVEAVLPTLVEHSPGFKNDLVLMNTGLHYYDDVICEGGSCRVPGPDSAYARDLRRLADYRAANLGSLPKMVWMDTPPQHFPGTGNFAGKFKSETCTPLEAWRRGDPVARAGGTWNVAAALLVPRLADAHLRTWNASVPLWDSHPPGECTHWCHPTAYQIWIYQLNGLLKARRLGTAAQLQGVPLAAAGVTSWP